MSLCTHTVHTGHTCMCTHVVPQSFNLWVRRAHEVLLYSSMHMKRILSEAPRSFYFIGFP